jgi:hypothetical protein
MVVGNAPILVDKATGHTHLGRSDLSVAEQIAPARPPMSNALTARFPEIVYLLRTYLDDAGTLSDEMDQYAAAENVERALQVVLHIHELLSDTSVIDDQLDAFIRTHSAPWYGSGRATLEHVGEALLRVMETQASLRPPRHMLERLAAWSREQGLIPPDDLTDWTIVDAGQDRWGAYPTGLLGRDPRGDTEHDPDDLPGARVGARRPPRVGHRLIRPRSAGHPSPPPTHLTATPGRRVTFTLT